MRVSGCFRGTAKRVSSCCLSYLTVLENEEQLLPALPPFTLIFKRRTAQSGLCLLIEAITLQPELRKLIVGHREGNGDLFPFVNKEILHFIS